MTTYAHEVIAAMEQLPQAQYCLTTQLNELYAAALKLGLYDAADFLTPHSPPTRRPAGSSKRKIAAALREIEAEEEHDKRLRQAFPRGES